MRIERLRQDHNLTVKWTHFPLHPDTPAEGRTLEAMFGVGQDQVSKMQGEMKERMEAEGLAFGVRNMTFNSRLAQELGAWADSVDPDVGGLTHDAFFRAYFVEGQNLADRRVLLEVAASVGLPTDTAEHVIDERLFGDAVDGDWDRSRQLGVSGVPTFVIGQQMVVGAQPFEVLDRWATETLRGGV